MENVAILRQALPYIRRYKGKTFVVKLGGELVQHADVLDDIAQDVSLLHQIGIKILIVHGGGPHISETIKKRGGQTQFIKGFRYTDQETMQIVEEVLIGEVNVEIVNAINEAGGRAQVRRVLLLK